MSGTSGAAIPRRARVRRTAPRHHFATRNVRSVTPGTPITRVHSSSICSGSLHSLFARSLVHRKGKKKGNAPGGNIHRSRRRMLSYRRRQNVKPNGLSGSPWLIGIWRFRPFVRMVICCARR